MPCNSKTKSKINFITKLTYWYELHSVQPTQESILQEMLWNNKYILIDNNPINVNYIHWNSQGIKTLADISDINGNFLTRESIQIKYNLSIKQMDYNSLITAIPTLWRSMMKTVNSVSSGRQVKPNSNIICIGNTLYDIDLLSNKKFYNMFITHIITVPTSLSKWIDEFPFLNDKDFDRFYVLPSMVVTDIKCQVFQFKILHRMIVCKCNPMKWGVFNF